MSEEGDPVAVIYRNWRGEVAQRHVIPREIRFGSTEHHPTPQWLLEVWDCDKEAARTFAMAGVIVWALGSGLA